MIEVEIEDPAWSAALPEAERLAAAAAEAALRVATGETPPPSRASGAIHLPRFAGEERAGAAPPRAGELSAKPTEGAFGLVLLLTDDAAVRDLNARFRGKDKPTNVLSFPAAPNSEGHLGDVAVAFGVCAQEAADQGKSLADHLQHLVAHGVLHLLGYDHIEDDEAEEMEGLERVVLAGLGVADPYEAGERDYD